MIQEQSAQYIHLLSLCALVGLVSVPSGCGEPTSPAIPGVGHFGTDGFGTGTESGDADDGVDETAGENELDPGLCLIEAVGAYVGERYQCQGFFEARFGADGVEENGFPVSFGYPDSGDSYEKPFVSACCAPVVGMPSCPGEANQHLWACYIDAVQQMCVGLGTKVEEVRSNVPPAQAFIKPSLEALRDWLNLETSIFECTENFITNTGMTTFDCAADYSDALEGVTWTLSETNHGLIDNPYVRIETIEVSDVEKPEVGEPCTDLHDNDSYIPLEIGPEEPGWTKLVLADGTATLNGPELDGEGVTGTAGLASVATGCEGKSCSAMAANLQLGSGAWRLEGMRLHSVGAAVASNRSTSVEVDEYTISLFTPVKGTVRDGVYEIAPGAAVFSLSGRTGFGDYSLTTTNASSIAMKATANGWVLSPFDLRHVDRNGDEWRLVVDAASWAPSPRP